MTTFLHCFPLQSQLFVWEPLLLVVERVVTCEIHHLLVYFWLTTLGSHPCELEFVWHHLTLQKSPVVQSTVTQLYQNMGLCRIFEGRLGLGLVDTSLNEIDCQYIKNQNWMFQVYFKQPEVLDAYSSSNIVCALSRMFIFVFCH